MAGHIHRAGSVTVVLFAALCAGACATKRDVVVRSTPDGANVSIAGRRVGTTPHRTSHTWSKDEDVLNVAVAMEGYEAVTRRVTRSQAKSGKGPLNVAVELAPLVHTQKVLITSNVDKAFVRIDEQDAGRTPLLASLKFTREDSSRPWSTFLVQVAKDKYQYVPPSGAAKPIFSTTVTLDQARAGKLTVPLEPVKYYLGMIRRFRVEKDGIRTEEEVAPSRVGEIEREPKASAVTQVTQAPSYEPLVETRVSVTSDSSVVACSIPIWERGKDEPVGSSIWLRSGSRATRMTDGRFFDVEPYVTSDGKWVYFSSNRLGRMTIWRVAATGRGGLQKVTDSPSALVDYEPAVSPDGSRLAYTSLLPSSDTPQIWLANPDGTLPTQIREGRSPAWSPDGSKLAYVARDELSGNECVWVMSADGSNPTRVTNSDCSSRQPSWTPDGKIVYACNRGLNDQNARNFDIWRMNDDGSNPTQLTVNGSYDARPVVSPDNKYLYFVSNRGAQRERDDSLQIWRMAF